MGWREGRQPSLEDAGPGARAFEPGDLGRADLGIINPGYAGQPELSWGFASSPIIYENLVILQCDRQEDSFIVAFNIADGSRAWRTERDDIPAWSTPGALSGAQLYQNRIGTTNSTFSASPIASGGRIYFSSEDGEVFVIKAGPKYELLSLNRMGEPLMATPAASDGIIVIRGQRHLFAVR